MDKCLREELDRVNHRLNWNAFMLQRQRSILVSDVRSKLDRDLAIQRWELLKERSIILDEIKGDL